MFKGRIATIAAAIIGLAAGTAATAQVARVAQTPMPGSAIPQFIDPLPDLHTIVAGGGQIQLNLEEFKTNVLPAGFVLPNGQPYTGTWVWGYLEAGQTAIPSYIGPVVVATRGTPTEMKFVNNLGTSAGTNVLAYSQSTDQTMHWADPLNGEMNMCAHDIVPGQPPTGFCAELFDGAIPAVVHLHGGEVPPEIDGGPDAWFTSDGGAVGHSYYSKDGTAAKNYAIYRYPNTQEAAPIWFHDHTLGATRLGVYAGMAGAYVLTDPALNLPANLPGPADIVPLVIQDRTFDTNGQLFLHAGPPFAPNPEHPQWVPEFIGDVVVVNGKAWPFKNVEKRRYRFLFLNGSNARTYELFLADAVSGASGPPMWVIGTDGGYLDAPVKIDPARGQRLTIMPGERYEVIIDFADTANNPNASGSYLMRNTARAPYPKGAPPNGTTLGRVMMFRVGAVPAGGDTSYNPAAGTPLRTGGQAIVRLADPAAGTLAAGLTVDKTRQLTLNEVMMPPTTVNGIAYPGGPLEVLVNNTKWDGLSADKATFAGGVRPDFNLSSLNGIDTYISERPQEGDVEVWEIVNLTADAHPIHLHLVQFQILNRQRFNMNKYSKVYNAAFPGGAFFPAYGPPLDYNTGNARALGGNPDITRYLQGPPKPPSANEAGWKDTAVMYPGEVTRIAVRWAPTDLPVATAAADRYFDFDPSGDAVRGYVWHCHIIDHEDNEMMRPDLVDLNLAAPAPASRPYKKGTEY